MNRLLETIVSREVNYSVVLGSLDAGSLDTILQSSEPDSELFLGCQVCYAPFFYSWR
jgi:hypothetical protein